MHQGQSNYPKFLPRFAIIKSVFSCFPMFMIFRPEDPEAWRSFGCTKVREVVSRVDEKVQGGARVFLPEQLFIHGNCRYSRNIDRHCQVEGVQSLVSPISSRAARRRSCPKPTFCRRKQQARFGGFSAPKGRSE